MLLHLFSVIILVIVSTFYLFVMIIQDEDKTFRSCFLIVYNICISFLICYSAHLLCTLYITVRSLFNSVHILGGLFDTTEEADRDTKQETAFRYCLKGVSHKIFN